MSLRIEDLQKICTAEHIQITLHATKRLEQRKILINDILSAIRTGVIIEQYPDDYPYPSCLILGCSSTEVMLHVVVGSDMETLWIVTAYFPDPAKWEDNFKTRKEI